MERDYLSERLWVGGIVKIDLALVKGKKLYDKREDSRRKDDQREIQRTMKNINNS